MNDGHDNAIIDKAQQDYITRNHLDKPINIKQCHFCEEELKYDVSEMSYTTEVGEFWSKTLKDSALAHPDCLPYGIDAVFNNDPECDWRMA